MLTVKGIEKIINYKYIISDSVQMVLNYIPLNVDDRYAFEVIHTNENTKKIYDIEIYREPSVLSLTPKRLCYMVYIRKKHSFDTDAYIVNGGHLSSMRYLSHSLFMLIRSEYVNKTEQNEFYKKT